MPPVKRRDSRWGWQSTRMKSHGDKVVIIYIVNYWFCGTGAWTWLDKLTHVCQSLCGKQRKIDRQRYKCQATSGRADEWTDRQAKRPTDKYPSTFWAIYGSHLANWLLSLIADRRGCRRDMTKAKWLTLDLDGQRV